MTDGLGVVPLARVLPPRTAIGHTRGEDIQEKEGNPEATKKVSTQPPSIGTTSPSGIAASIPPFVNVSTGQPRLQTFTSTIEKVKIRNIESDSDVEEEDLDQQQPLGSE